MHFACLFAKMVFWLSKQQRSVMVARRWASGRTVQHMIKILNFAVISVKFRIFRNFIRLIYLFLLNSRWPVGPSSESLFIEGLYLPGFRRALAKRLLPWDHLKFKHSKENFTATEYAIELSRNLCEASTEWPLDSGEAMLQYICF